MRVEQNLRPSPLEFLSRSHLGVRGRKPPEDAGGSSEFNRAPATYTYIYIYICVYICVYV